MAKNARDHSWHLNTAILQANRDKNSAQRRSDIGTQIPDRALPQSVVRETKPLVLFEISEVLWSSQFSIDKLMGH